MRTALATLPWVEQDSVQPDTKTRRVRFKVPDRQQFDIAAVQKALEAEGFRDAKLLAGPGETKPPDKDEKPKP